MKKPRHEMDLVDLLEEDFDDEPDLEQLTVFVPEQLVNEGKEYELVPDRVLPLSKKKYTRWEAYKRFAEIAEAHKYHLIGVTEDARNWVFKVLDSVVKK